MDTMTSDIITVSTLIGYVKIKCSQSTTVEEIISAAVKKVSISSAPSMFGLEIREAPNQFEDRQFLCPHLTWSEISGLANNQKILLSVRFFPTNFEDSIKKDRSALFYLHDQVNRFYKSIWDECRDSQACFEIGCLEIKIRLDSVFSEDALEKLEKSRELSSFFPTHVLHQQKAKHLRRAILNYAPSIHYYSKEDCMLERLNRLLILTRFDSDTYKCYLGAGLGIPVRLLLGPRSQVRVNIGNTDEVRMLCYFISIGQIIFSEVNRKEGRRYQVKLILSNDPDANQPIIFTFDSKLTADTVLHTLEGYCKLSPPSTVDGAPVVMPVDKRASLLYSGCPFRHQRPVSVDDISQKSLHQDGVLVRSHITLERVLGEGQFGDVYKGTYRPPEAGSSVVPVAVKACKVGLSSDEKQRCIEEADLHGKLNHPHIVKLYGVCRDEPVWLVLEFAAEGELRHYLLERQGRIHLSTLVTYCHQLASSLAYLEALRIIHRDVAARNVLVANENCVKLADFGMARELQEQDFYVAEQGRKVPIKWMAPESLQSRFFSTASDVWMFGVCMWEILSFGLKPFSHITNAEAVAAIGNGERLTRPDICLNSHYRLMLECWMEDPVLRPTFSSLQPKLREILTEARRLSTEKSTPSSRRSSENGQAEDQKLHNQPMPITPGQTKSFPSPSSTPAPLLPTDKLAPLPTPLRPSEADGPVHRAVYRVIEQILTITQKDKLPSPPQLLSSVKKVGEHIRTLFVIIQQTVEEIDDVSLIDSAERQLTDSYHYLIEDMNKLREFYTREGVRDELYRRFLGQAFVVASDSRTLYQSVQQCHKAHLLLSRHR